MKLVGMLTRKENTWVIQIPRPVLRVAELNGIRITSKVRVRIRIYRDTGEPIDTDAKVQIYGKSLDNCYLIIPQSVAQQVRSGATSREEVVFEIVEEEQTTATAQTAESGERVQTQGES